jgi:tetratricopeptide (TPR) repeat protein
MTGPEKDPDSGRRAARAFWAGLEELRRSRRGMSYPRLAGRLGMAPSTVHNWLTERVTLASWEEIEPIIAALGGDRGEWLGRWRRAGSPAAEEVSCGADPAARARVRPAQLPADVYGFAARGDQLARLDALLASATDEQPTGVVISAVSGTAGVGKTALAVHWAHRVREKFPDGQLYVNLRGFDPGAQAMAPAEAVRGFLDALGIPPERVPPNPDSQAALYRSLLDGKRVLVVLDNARDAEQARPLLPGTPAALVLVTSRNQLSSLVAADGAHPLTLDLLTKAGARELLARRLGADRLAADPAAAEEIITFCARLPLALTIAAARAEQTGFPLTTLTAELAEDGGRLDALDTGDPATQVRAVFSWSYTALTPAAARLFRLLGLHPGPDIAAPAAASLAGHPRPVARRLLAELTRSSLIAEHAPGRYAFHDLLRAYAAHLAHSTDSEAERHEAFHRMLDHYLHTAYVGDRLIDPTTPDRITLRRPQPGTTPEALVDAAGAVVWFAAERLVLLALVDRAAATGFDTHAWQLAWTNATFLNRNGQSVNLAAAQTTALDAARRLADQPAQAHAHHYLGIARAKLGQDDDAHAHLREAVSLFAELGDRTGEARAHFNIAWMLHSRGRHQDALSHAEQVVELFRSTGDRAGEARALNAVGWSYSQLGDHSQTLRHCEQALIMHQEIGDTTGEACSWDSLGYAHHRLGDLAQAITCFRQALDLFHATSDRYGEADVLTHMGDAHHVAADPDAARGAWQQALNILIKLDSPAAHGVRAKLDQLEG